MSITWTLGDQIEWFDPSRFSGLRRRGLGQSGLIKEIHPFNKYSGIQKLTIGLLSSKGTVNQEVVIEDSEILLIKSAADILKDITPQIDFQKLQTTKHIPKHWCLDNGLGPSGKLLSSIITLFQSVQKNDTVEFLWASRHGAQVFTAYERCHVEDNLKVGLDSYIIIQTPRGDKVEITYDPVYMETLLP